MVRNQRSDIERLRLQAEDLWEQQQDVLHRARALMREAGRQGIATATPRIQRALESGAGAARSLGQDARQRVERDVMPALTTAIGGAIATMDVLRDKQLRHALTGAGSVGRRVTPVPAAPKPSYAGLWVGIGLGVVAAAAVGYVVWQTLRADDDLWIEDEPDGVAAED